MAEKGTDPGSPWRMPWAAWRAVAVRTWEEASDDNIGLVAAGVAFYGFLAVVPLLTAVVLIYGIFAEPETVIGHMRALMSVMPPHVAHSVGEQLMTVVGGSDGKKGVGALVAIAIALFGARSAAGSLISALNIAYDEKEKRGFVRINLIALAITAAGAVGAVLAAFAIAGLSAIGELLPYTNDALVILGTALSYALLTLAGSAGAGALYRFAPSRDGHWVWISPGSVLAGLLWLLLTLGFGAYVAGFAHYDTTYGPLGAVVALLSWMYLSSYVLLFGAELNAELDHLAAEAADPIAGPAPAAAGPAMPVEAATPAGHREAATKPSFIASRVAVRAAQLGGLPRVGWIVSGLASLGLTMLRRRGRTGAGLALVAAAAGISWLGPRK